jgi:hypothetical protein
VGRAVSASSATAAAAASCCPPAPSSAYSGGSSVVFKVDATIAQAEVHIRPGRNKGFWVWG